jgi:hypothetical protein
MMVPEIRARRDFCMNITRALVLAKFAQLFGAHPDSEALLALLDRYGARERDRERERVQLAILKLGAGDPDKLRHNVEAALVDYRDVLAWAEYPKQMDTGATVFNSPAEEIQEIRKSDRSQYRDWLEVET